MTDPTRYALFASAGIAVFAVLSLLVLAFWIWMIVDCARRTFDEPNAKLIWMLVIVVTWFIIPVIGSIVYFFAGRPQGRLPGKI